VYIKIPDGKFGERMKKERMKKAKKSLRKSEGLK